MPHGSVSADKTVEFRINDEDDTSSLDVVMTQVFVNIFASVPGGQIRVSGKSLLFRFHFFKMLVVVIF